jgi:predicted transcriptional regulator
MCVGIAIIGIVPADGGPIQFFGKEGNSSHDELLSENVPADLHNRSFKMEYLFPNTIRLDAPDEECQKQAFGFGVADTKFGTLVLKHDVLEQVWGWIQKTRLVHDIKTLQGAYLQGADLQGARVIGP